MGTRNRFFSEYWDEKWAHFAHGSRFFADLIAVDDIDHLLHLSNLDYGRRIRLLNSRNPAAVPGFPDTGDTGANAIKVYLGLSRGCSLNIIDIQDVCRPIQLLCREFEEAFSFPVNCNLYYTPPRAQAFRPHFDDHDIFVLQVVGSKLWEVYERVRICPGRGEGREVELPTDSEPMRSVLLRDGDSLYLPRGYVHQASALSDASLHLTVGLYSYTWGDLLHAGLDQMVENDADLRRSLPPGALIEKGDTDGFMNAQFGETINRVVSQARVEDALHVLGKAFVSTIRPICDSHISGLAGIESVNVETYVKKKKGMITIVESDEDQVSIVYPGNAVSGPPSISSCLEYIAGKQESFRAKDLPGPLSVDSRLVLVRRLLQEGLLCIDQHIAHCDSSLAQP